MPGIFTLTAPRCVRLVRYRVFQYTLPSLSTFMPSGTPGSLPRRSAKTRSVCHVHTDLARRRVFWQCASRHRAVPLCGNGQRREAAGPPAGAALAPLGDGPSPPTTRRAGPPLPER
jgi:hypothetical protein